MEYSYSPMHELYVDAWEDYFTLCVRLSHTLRPRVFYKDVMYIFHKIGWVWRFEACFITNSIRLCWS